MILPGPATIASLSRFAHSSHTRSVPNERTRRRSGESYAKQPRSKNAVRRSRRCDCASSVHTSAQPVGEAAETFPVVSEDASPIEPIAAQPANVIKALEDAELFVARHVNTKPRPSIPACTPCAPWTGCQIGTDRSRAAYPTATSDYGCSQRHGPSGKHPRSTTGAGPRRRKVLPDEFDRQVE